MAKAATLKAPTSSVRKRKSPRKGKVPTASPFRLTPEHRELRARLRELYNAAYRDWSDAPSEKARTHSRACKEYRARKDVDREVFNAEVEKELAKHCGSGGMLRPRKYTAPDQLVALAVIGEFRLEGDRAAASMIRRAAGLR